MSFPSGTSYVDKDALPPSKLILLDTINYTTGHNKIVNKARLQWAVDNLDLHLTQFEDIYISRNHQLSYVFTDFQTAFNYGKRAALKGGFSIRTKTSSHNKNHGVYYKYTSCSREGIPFSLQQNDSSTAPRSPIFSSAQPNPDVHSSSTRQNMSRSNRCGCLFACRLIGVELDKMPEEFVSTLRPYYQHDIAYSMTSIPQPSSRKSPDLCKEKVWYWDFYDRSESHNHPLFRQDTSPATATTSLIQTDFSSNTSSSHDTHTINTNVYCDYEAPSRTTIDIRNLLNKDSSSDESRTEFQLIRAAPDDISAAATSSAWGSALIKRYRLHWDNFAIKSKTDAQPRPLEPFTDINILLTMEHELSRTWINSSDL